MSASQQNEAQIRSWCMYDWANSVYSLIITSTLFPVYYNLVAKNPAGGNEVMFLGFPVLNSALISFAISFSFLLSGLLSPILSAIADLSGWRRRFLFGFCTLGSLACMGLSAFGPGSLEYGILLFVVAAVGYSSSIVFYNSFLPDIAQPDSFAEISGRGFSYGYIGSVILLILILLPLFIPNLPLVGGMEIQGICRMGFFATGIWWMGFGFYAVMGLPKKEAEKGFHFPLAYVARRLKEAFEKMEEVPSMRRYLLGFFLVNTGVQTVMYLAAVFGDQELHMPSEQLILTILIVQLVAIVGASGFSALSRRLGDLPTLMLACLLWIVVCVWAWMVKTDVQFMTIAALVGLVMGGTQSMVRAAFTSRIPKEEHGKSALYGLFDLLDKFSIVLGTFLFGLINQLFGSMRYSALSLGFFFLAGCFMLYATLRKEKA